MLESGWLSRRREILIVLSSLLLQMPLAYFLGHYYDERVFMATGYVVNSGVNPYQPIELLNVFPHTLLTGMVPRIGYPPPWPLVLGLVFRLSYNVVPDVFVYNFAIKIPTIIANIGLAYLVSNILVNLHASDRKAKASWLFLLFNPFVLLTTSAWGQFDTIVAFLCVASLYALSKGKVTECGLLLALSVSLKPITLPLIPLPLLFFESFRSRNSLKYALVFLAAVFAFAVAPFFLLGWSLPVMPTEWNGQFNMAGGMTLFNLAELIQQSTLLPQNLAFLGFLWVPALIVSYYVVYRNPPRSADELFGKAVGLTLVFFLTRSWLSEPNINLLLPLLLVLVGLNKLSSRSLHLAWIVPLVFMVLNTSISQLFFLAEPSVLMSLAEFDQQFRVPRLVARFAVAAVWSVLGWRIAIGMLGGKRKATNSNG